MHESGLSKRSESVEGLDLSSPESRRLAEKVAFLRYELLCDVADNAAAAYVEARRASDQAQFSLASARSALEQVMEARNRAELDAG